MVQDDLYELGRERGREFATTAFDDYDRRDELINLQKLRMRRAGSRWEQFFEPMAIPTSKVAENVFQVMHTGELFGPGEQMTAYAEFEATILREFKIHANNPSFVRGFADGALETWVRIKEHT